MRFRFVCGVSLTDLQEVLYVGFVFLFLGFWSMPTMIILTVAKDRNTLHLMRQQLFIGIS